MIITKSISPKECSDICICICGEIANLEIDNYSSEPMVWCDLCYARLIICKNCPPTKIDITDSVKYYEKYYEDIDCDLIKKQCEIKMDAKLWNLMCKKSRKELNSNLKTLKSWNNTANKFKLMNIDKISTQQIYQNRWIDDVTEDQIIGVINGSLDSKDFIIEEDAFIDFEYENDSPPNNMFITLPCKTYDIEENKIKNLDTSHDGCVIWIKCYCELCGTYITMNYSGD